ncbi:MAG: glycosyltransferase [Clostridia bacterium]|nr:glycosyltransferase [Clostridia bacterium]
MQPAFQIKAKSLRNGLIFLDLKGPSGTVPKLALYVQDALVSSYNVYNFRTSSNCSFAYPIPAQLLDGAPRSIIFRLYPEDVSDLKSTQFLTETTTICRTPKRYGHVDHDGRHCTGWVAFSQRPAIAPTLEVHNHSGQLIKVESLIPLPAPDHYPDSFVARFRFPITGMHFPLHVSSGEIQLQGSPCNAPSKLTGVVNSVSENRIRGWAFDLHRPLEPVQLVLKIDGKPHLYFRPNMRCPEIARYIKIPEDKLGIVGFELPVPEEMYDGKEHQLDIAFVKTGLNLRGSAQNVCIPQVWEELNPHCFFPQKKRPVKRPARPVVSVVVLNRDGEQLLNALLSSWVDHNSLSNIEFIVVDHDSIDNSLNVLNKWARKIPIHVIALDTNDSFSQSCNRGTAEAKGRYVLYLNNDIVWVYDALPEMLRSLEEHQEIGAVGLKLLRSANDDPNNRQAQVQHLGVRFKLSGTAYWPYEVTPCQHESEYAPQLTPAVTAAAMLCRRKDILAIGGFDPAYFYGFEDVELCLRLQSRSKKRVICRNDLVALHRHGHTRLSGRALDTYKRVTNNEDVLQAQVGSWLKHAYWKDILTGKRSLAGERLTFGLICDNQDTPGDLTILERKVQRHAKHLFQAYPHAKVVMLRPSQGWYTIRQIHVLLVGHLDYDIRLLSEQRSDLVIIACVFDRPQVWTTRAWWNLFDFYLAANHGLSDRLRHKTSGNIHIVQPLKPLGDIFCATHPPLRIAITSSPKSNQQEHNACLELYKNLRTTGAMVWMEDSNISAKRRLANIRVWVRSTINATPPENEVHTVGILWDIDNTGTEINGWIKSTSKPTYKFLARQYKDVCGNTFRSS